MNSPTEDQRLPISCCMILKNEELFLKRSIGNFIKWIDELLIFDSGSTDQTLNIAESFRSQVPQLLIEKGVWKDDFSFARNFIAAKARNKWILFIDGDEIIEDSARSKIAAAIQSDKICFSLIQRNYTKDSNIENIVSCSKAPTGLTQDDLPLFYFDNWMERLYRNDKNLRFEGRVHESLIPSVERIEEKVQKLDILLHHYGRLKNTTQEKILYYLNLSEKKWQEDKKNPAAWIEYMTALMETNHIEGALKVAIEATGKFLNELEILKIVFQIFLRSNNFSAAENILYQFLKLKPDDLYARTQLTTALLYQKKWPETLKAAHDLLQLDPKNFVAHVNLGVLYFEFKDWKKSKEHLNAARDIKPHDEFVKSSLEKINAEIQNN